MSDKSLTLYEDDPESGLVDLVRVSNELGLYGQKVVEVKLEIVERMGRVEKRVRFISEVAPHRCCKKDVGEVIDVAVG